MDFYDEVHMCSYEMLYNDGHLYEMHFMNYFHVYYNDGYERC